MSRPDPTVSIVIPARWASSRFPGKPLALIAGKTLIQRVWENARKVPGVDQVCVATDDPRIEEHCRSFGASVLMTRPECRNGTERVLEAAHKMGAASGVFVNWQGDAPLTPPHAVEALVQRMKREPFPDVATPVVELRGERARELIRLKASGDTGIVTAALNAHGRALYFSRSLIPYPRHADSGCVFYRHVGLYAYTREALEKAVSLPPSPLEETEELEQLRFLENGMSVYAVAVDYKGAVEWEVNRPEDVAEVEKILSH